MRALETDEVEGQIVSFGLALLIMGKRIDAVEHGRFLCKNHCIFDKVLPFDGMQLLEVLEKCHASVLVGFIDNFAQ